MLSQRMTQTALENAASVAIGTTTLGTQQKACGLQKTKRMSQSTDAVTAAWKRLRGFR